MMKNQKLAWWGYSYLSEFPHWEYCNDISLCRTSLYYVLVSSKETRLPVLKPSSASNNKAPSSFSLDEFPVSHYNCFSFCHFTMKHKNSS